MKISVIIPVWNEEKYIKKTLSSLQQENDSTPLEIIVVDGKSEDKTIMLAQNWPVKIIKALRRGRAYQMHRGALVATGDVLLFLHADTQLPPGWKNQLKKAWGQDKKPAVVAFSLGFDKNNLWFYIIQKAARLRNLITHVPQGDQALSCWRETYFKIGGFPDISIMEEYELTKRLKSKGEIKILQSCVITSVRRYKKWGPFITSLRNSFIVFLYYLGLPHHYLVKLYRS